MLKLSTTPSLTQEVFRLQVVTSSSTPECPQLVVSTLHYRETPRWAAAGDKIWSRLLPATSETESQIQISGNDKLCLIVDTRKGQIISRYIYIYIDYFVVLISPCKSTKSVQVLVAAAECHAARSSGVTGQHRDRRQETTGTGDQGTTTQWATP